MEGTCRLEHQTEPQSVPEKALVMRAKEGDASAFEELVQRGEIRIRRLATYLCRGNHADGEDTYQNALLAAFLHIGDFRGDSRFSTWLTRIVIRECGMRFRNWQIATRWQSLDEELDWENKIRPTLADGSDSPEEESARQEFQEIIRHSMKGKEDYWQPFFLSEILGLSNREIADHLGLSLAATKSRILRARQYLKRSLQKRFCPPGHCYWPGSTSKTAHG
jgi:RNA polymerase sigma-70 factor (ECF subfamily)